MSVAAIPAPVERMLAEARVCRLCTVGTDGWPRLRTVAYRWDGERLLVPTGADPAVDDIRADARVAVLVDSGSRFDELRGALVHGRARPLEAPELSLQIRPERATWWDLAGPSRR